MHMRSIEEFRHNFTAGLGAKNKRGQLPTNVAWKEPVFRLASSRAEEVAGKERTLRFTFSDSTIDRAGDTINQDGWELKSFLANPIALWAHDSSSPPIGRATNVSVVGKKLMGDITFADNETYAFADTIYRLCKGGFISAVSVGFNPIEWSFVNTQERPFGIDFKRQELLEISVVPVPANANALIEARSAGIDTRPLVEWAQRLLDSGSDFAVVKRADLESLRKLAAEAMEAVAPNDEDKMTEKAAGEGANQDGSGLVGDSDAAPLGNCGKAKDAECGMKDPQQCAVHRDYGDALDGDDYEGKILRVLEKLGVLKGKRVLSVANHKDLSEAAEHHEIAADHHQKASDLHVKAAAHHKAAHDLIKSVLARHDAAYDPDGDGDDDSSPTGDTDHDYAGRRSSDDVVVSEADIVSRRLAKVKALRLAAGIEAAE